MATMTRKYSEAVRNITIGSPPTPLVRRGVAAPPYSELRYNGFTTLAVTSDACAALQIASIAFQGQLDRCSDQPAQQRPAEYTEFPRKQRLELKLGSAMFDESRPLKQLAITTMKQYDKLAKEILSQLAESLSLPATVFDSLLESCNSQDRVHVKTASALEATRYDVTDAHASCTDTSDTSANCAAHIDKGLLTLIYADTEQGLQIMEHNGQWRDLLVPAGRIAVLTGYTLERATCGHVPATAHKVVLDNIVERNTLVYKLRARGSAVTDLYPAISSVNFSYINRRFHGPIAVHELMTIFAKEYKSVNVLQIEDGNNKAGATVVRIGDHDVVIPSALGGFLSLGNMINIQFLELTGVRKTLLVSNAMPYSALISAYAAFVKSPLQQLRIIFRGSQFDEESQESLKDMGILHGSVLHVVLRMRGD